MKTNPRLRFMLLMCGLCVLVEPAMAKPKRPRTSDTLASYVERVQAHQSAAAPTLGSVWTTSARLINPASDNKARNIDDPIIIRIIEQTRAEAESNLKTQRNLQANSGVDSFFGQLGPRNGFRSILSANSNSKLQGQGQTASSSLLTTSLGGHVAQVLPNGALIIEAMREIEMDGQRQSIIVRGVVRPDDISPDNVVLSTQVSDLEVELKGKGVISDATHRPNFVVRWLLRLLTF